jgi:hypothetical protein
MQEENYAVTTFNADLRDFHSFKNISSTSVDEVLIGFDNNPVPDQVSVLSGLLHPNSNVYAIASYGESLFSLIINVTQITATGRRILGTHTKIHASPAVYDFDYVYESAGNYAFWGAVETTDAAIEDLYLIYIEYVDADPHGDMWSFSIQGMTSKPDRVSVHYSTRNLVYFTTVEPSGKASMYKFSDANDVLALTEVYLGFNLDTYSPLHVFYNRQGYVFVSTMIQASSDSATAAQMIILGSNTDLDFSGKN